MKKIFVFFCLILFFFGFAGAASALTYTDSFDAGDFRMDPWGSNSSISWTFDITGAGFDPLTQDVTSASVSIWLSDDKRDRWPWLEVAILDVGENLFLWKVDTGEANFEVTSLMTLSDFGRVDATLRSLYGDFYFNTAELFAEGTVPNTNSDPIPNPEPATLFLYGTGLMGVALIARNRFREKYKL